MIYKSKKAKKLYRERILKKLLLKVFFPFYFLLFFSLWFFNTDFLKIQSVEVKNNKNISTQKIEKIFFEELKSKYISFYSKNNFLFYPENKIEKRILRQEKGISDIDISYKGIISKNIVIKIQEKIPAFLFCQNEKQNKCYFVENNGNIFSEHNPSWVKKQKGEFLVFIKDFKSDIPKEVLAEKNFTKIKSLILDLENIGLEIEEVILGDNSEFLLKTGSGAKVVVFLDQDFEKILESLNKIINKEDLKIDFKNKDFKNRVEYINLTFGENIYYCMAGDKCQNNF